MDNLTHSLVGLAAADLCNRVRERRSGTPLTEVQKRVAWGISLVAANVPDLDALYAPITEGRLGYLLHHRGHTHTLVGILITAVALGFGLHVLRKRRGWELSRGDGWANAGLIAFGLLSHLILDGLNVYGIHPFWPFDNQWYFGDTLFIVEPWLWLLLSPPLYFAASTRFARSLMGVIFVAGSSLTILTGQVPWYLALLPISAGLALMKWLPKVDARWRTALCVGLTALPMSLFIWGGQAVKNGVQELSAGEGVEMRSVAISPLPANPLCWMVLTTETYGGGAHYRLRLGIWGMFPSLLPPDRCPSMGLGKGTARLMPTAESSEPSLHWVGEVRNSVTRLRELAQSNCQVAAFLRFARAPFFQEAGQDLLMGDLRFDRQRGLGFAEIQTLRVPLRCPQFVPDWDEPFWRALQSP